MTKRKDKKSSKTRKIKRQHGGSDWRTLMLFLHGQHITMSLSKPVTTFINYAGSPGYLSPSNRFMKIWYEVKDNKREMEEFEKYGIRKFGSPIGVCVSNPDDLKCPSKDAYFHTGNFPILYLTKYMDLLAQAADMSLDQLLNILICKHEPNTFETDLIIISYGDMLKEKTDIEFQSKLNTVKGKETLTNYFGLLIKMEKTPKEHAHLRNFREKILEIFRLNK